MQFFHIYGNWKFNAFCKAQYLFDLAQRAYHFHESILLLFNGPLPGKGIFTNIDCELLSRLPSRMITNLLSKIMSFKSITGIKYVHFD